MGTQAYIRRRMREGVKRGDVPAESGACAISGCRLPWSAHHTKTGKLKKEFKDHRPADWKAESAYRMALKIKAKKEKS